eukprot:6873133-Prymnesium_polylepis.2
MSWSSSRWCAFCCECGRPGERSRRARGGVWGARGAPPQRGSAHHVVDPRRWLAAGIAPISHLRNARARACGEQATGGEAQSCMSWRISSGWSRVGAAVGAHPSTRWHTRRLVARSPPA